MSQVYTFHKTVRGHLHITNDFPCEDFSTSYSAEDGKYHIAVVADGHGSKSCFRSNVGSKAAADVALECLKEFAETSLISKEIENRFYQDIFSNPRYRQMTMRRLTDTILAGWNDRVLDDYTKNAPTAEEMGESAAEYESGKNLTHIYGTTLMAALQLPRCLLLIHQGDGRCDVFYADGSVDQPIPWDSRCEGNVTTSLCDEDAADSFRSCVLDLSEKPVMACYLGCDGVEDAYRDNYESLGGSHILMGGVHTFYKDLTCQLVNMGKVKFMDSLEGMLSDFSANGKFSRSGSGDDVSVAGIVDLDAIPKFISRFTYDVKKYALEEDLFWKEHELQGKTRKHGILKKRLEEAGFALKKAQEKQQVMKDAILVLNNKKQEYLHEAEKAQKDLKTYEQDSQQVSEQFEGKFARFATMAQNFFDNLSKERGQKEAAYRQILKAQSECDSKIEMLEKAISEHTETIRKLESERDDAQAKFDEYDKKYQAIDSDRIRIEHEIAALQEETTE